MSRTALLVLALAAVAFGSACGKSSKSEPSTSSGAATHSATTSTPSGIPGPTAGVKVASGKPLTQAQWVARGDAICGNLTRELKKLQISGTAELPRVLPREAALVRAEVSQLAKLVPPADKAGDWQQLLNSSSQWAEGTARLAEDPNIGRVLASSPAVKAVVAAHSRASEIAKHNGFRECAAV